MDFSADIVKCEETDKEDRKNRDDTLHIRHREVKIGSAKSEFTAPSR